MHWTRTITHSAIALTMAAMTLSSHAQSKAGTAAPQTASATSEQDWWKNAVIYEIYPRSFQDSNGDGIGDLNGITERLDYLKELGIDAIWLSPIYPSPQVDFGYDISDYKNIDPQYGTLKDFDHLVAEANKRHIRILMDMVMNHSSDKHEWFEQSRSSRTNPYRDWYVWHDGKGETATDKGEVPNNWQSAFGHSAWEWDEKTRQYYYHKFYIQQPDLNWNNPKVHDAFKDIIGFWLKRGVGGFRFDAIPTLFEDPQLRDEELALGKDGKSYVNALGDVAVTDTRTSNLPEVHPVMQEMRSFSDTFNSDKFPGTRVFIGETYLPNIAELAKQYGPEGKPEFHLPMDTQIGFINKLDVASFRAKINDVETGINGNVPLVVFDNHDNPRLDARYGDGVHDTDIQRVIAAMLFATRGTALFYYGDEIGMKTTPPTKKEDVKDPVGLIGWPKEKGRDGERTPMQWSDGANAGFAKAGVTTWLPVPSSYSTVNVKAEETKPASLLDWYKTIIHLKKTNAALEHGDNVMLDVANDKVLSWLRQSAGAASVVVTVNFTAEPQTVGFTIPNASGKVKTLLKTPGAAEPSSLGQIQLGPYGVYIGELE
jgi:alpha-glucosidase